jgi:hypothetical protein
MHMRRDHLGRVEIVGEFVGTGGDAEAAERLGSDMGAIGIRNPFFRKKKKKVPVSAQQQKV